jgi:hypothetical protein
MSCFYSVRALSPLCLGLLISCGEDRATSTEDGGLAAGSAEPEAMSSPSDATPEAPSCGAGGGTTVEPAPEHAEPPRTPNGGAEPDGGVGGRLGSEGVSGAGGTTSGGSMTTLEDAGVASGPEPDGATDMTPSEPFDGGTTDASTTNGCDAERLWRSSERFAVVAPTDYGAAGDGETDDTAALEAAVDALPETGGIVLFGEGTYLKARQLWTVEKDHVLLWAPNGRATLHGTVRVRTSEELADDTFCGPREQATLFRRTVGGGVHGLAFSSDATERLSCAESSQIVMDGVDGFEVVGVEVSGSSATGLFAWSSDAEAGVSRNLRIVGNYIHHTYADSIHHTAGARRSWVWSNWIWNEEPSKGDDGIACVTYGIGSPRCGEMEWWENDYLGGAHGRGMAVIGGEDISIHHNWIIGAASAGLIVASEPSYDTESSTRIQLRDNWLLRSPNGSVDNGHSGILISGRQEGADPLSDIEATNNVIVDPAGERFERAEGFTENVVFDNETDPSFFPSGPPALASAAPRSTDVLRTWDTSFVTEEERHGLYRIHAKSDAGGDIVERFEYVFHAPQAELSTWLGSLESGDCTAVVVDRRAMVEVDFVLLLSAVPIEVPAEFGAPTFEELRAGDRDGTLTWLWQRLDQADYD